MSAKLPIKCAIIDKNRDRRESLRQKFLEFCDEVWVSNNTQWQSSPPPGEKWQFTGPASVDITFFHTGDRDHWGEDLAGQGISGLGEKVVWFSGAGVRGKNSLVPAGLGIVRRIELASSASSSEWKELLSFLATSGDTDWKELLDSLANQSSKPSSRRLPRLLLAQGPSVLIALSILCQGYIVAYDFPDRYKVGPEALSSVLTRDWWTRPFAPLGGGVLEQAQQDWGTTEVPTDVKILIEWIQYGLTPGDSLLPLPIFDDMVKRAKSALDAHLLDAQANAKPN